MQNVEISKLICLSFEISTQTDANFGTHEKVAIPIVITCTLTIRVRFL